ncbi:protein of unknown function [Nitrospira japonica]|uniref:Uncharacterized protein n=1 Tax=Nitrospira japonica TaxID=1325564 RepID=A0A1W1I809_9BACT|nr:protein of unknown function [Nitrospira japonica]
MMPGRSRVIQHLGPVSAGKLSSVDCTVSSEAYSNKEFREVQKVKETRSENPEGEKRGKGEKFYDGFNCIRRRTSFASSGRW